MKWPHNHPQRKHRAQLVQSWGIRGINRDPAAQFCPGPSKQINVAVFTVTNDNSPQTIHMHVHILKSQIFYSTPTVNQVSLVLLLCSIKHKWPQTIYVKSHCALASYRLLQWWGPAGGHAENGGETLNPEEQWHETLTFLSSFFFHCLFLSSQGLEWLSFPILSSCCVVCGGLRPTRSSTCPCESAFPTDGENHQHFI